MFFYRGLHGSLFGPTWGNDQSKGNINFCLVFLVLSAYERDVWEPPMHFVAFHMELKDLGMRGALSCICIFFAGVEMQIQMGM